MATSVPEARSSPWISTGLGVAIGTGVLLLFLLAGLILESWSVSDFLSNLTLETAGWFLLSSGMAVATIAAPIALYAHLRVVAPLVLLGLIVVIWLAIGVSTGIIEAGAIFGLSLYAIGLSPLYAVLYFVFGSAEYYVRERWRT
ncbi:hypothetical protein [Halosimplex marinum]|uniref:hypothetical protein n=1 Tax=Halosimplex marinum TaxID=3396620 RepID=UPI003F54AC6F